MILLLFIVKVFLGSINEDIEEFKDGAQDDRLSAEWWVPLVKETICFGGEFMKLIGLWWILLLLFGTNNELFLIGENDFWITTDEFVLGNPPATVLNDKTWGAYIDRSKDYVLLWLSWWGIFWKVIELAF